ncbi:MAG: hypothetical protein OEW12_03550, partial [Deltaproteobacteria bacterium]|nr:hypothetical protein [Deltaproteobacteria bacterium]
IEGDIHGDISPQWAQWMMSGLNLEVTLRILPEWIQKMGGLGGILTGYMNGDRLDVNIRGNMISPNIRQRE